MTPDSMANHRVLVLDDDAVMRELLEALLSLARYEVLSVSSGADALACLKARPVETVLTDLHMPGLEGEPLARALRAAMPHSALLIGMSGVAPSAEVLPLLDAFLSKPFDIEQLHAAVRSARRGRSSTPRETPVAGDTSVLGSVETSPQQDTAAAPPQFDSSAQPALDETIFASLSKMVPPRQLAELYNLTVSDVGKRHTRMVAAATVGDVVTVQREAHAIKGGCGMVGAAELAELAAAVEGGTTADTSAIAKFPAACLRLRRMLDAKLQTA